MLQRFLTAFAQVEAGNTSQNLLNKIRKLLKVSAAAWYDDLSYLMNFGLLQVFKIILNILSKNMKLLLLILLYRYTLIELITK